MKDRKLVATGAAMAALLAVGVVAQSQTTPVPPQTASVSAQSASGDAPKPAANAWMLTPTPYGAWNQDISPALRAQRDRFSDEISHQKVPLTVPSDAAEADLATSDVDMAAEPFDIMSAPNRAILTATFTKYRSVLSASDLSIYTEVTMHVDQVFEDQTVSGHPFHDRDITLLLSGGTVTLRSGSSLSYHVAPRRLFLQPGHRYLLVLSYESAADFYEPYDDWDISDGTVRANTGRTRALAKDGRSSLNGLAVDKLGPAVDKLLYAGK